MTPTDALRRAEQALDLVVNCEALSPTLKPERRDDAAASSQRREDVLREASRALNEVRAALAAAEKDGWQPIETAPRTGVTIQVFQPWKSGWDQIMLAHYANGWVWQAACDRCGVRDLKPTHWRPLPAPPSEG